MADGDEEQALGFRSPRAIRTVHAHHVARVVIGLALVSAAALTAAPASLWQPLAAGGLLTLALWRVRRPARPGRVVVSGDRVCFERGGRRITYPRASLKRGVVEVDRDAAWIVLCVGPEQWRLAVEDASEADAVLDRLALGATQQVAEFSRLESGAAAMTVFLALLVPTVVLVFASFVGEQVGAGDWLGEAPGRLLLAVGTVGVALGVWIAKRLQPSPVVVAVDGVRWRGLLREHVVRLAEVDDFDLQPRKLILVTSGYRHVIELGDTPAPRREALRRRVLAAWRAHDSDGGSVPELAPAPHENGEAWSTRLRSLLASGGYRAQVGQVPPFRAYAALEAPGAPALQRLGAAIALTAGTTTEPMRRQARARAGEIAGSLLDQPMAAALRSIASGQTPSPAVLDGLIRRELSR